ncbi:hypothetical protein QBC47DRAFT_68429 [Echria macrotheca]|uniref:Rhodopsin domain-containing protein n=1 Tax=Echria macrotheca TaxID=438768 RepID=A0AAJ0B638_9PEZI|nr:hypothetical protein QBC47DRAFT_68429 [Echria macrotheca]
MSSSTPEGSPPPSQEPVPDLGPNIAAAAFVPWAIALIFVALRCYTRANIIRTFGPSDWCIILSIICSTGLTATTYNQTQHGLGKHIYDFDAASEVPNILCAWWWSFMFYLPALSFTKVSICLLYLSIFPLRWQRWACYSVLVIVVVSSLFTQAAIFTYTIPLSATWDPTVVATYTTSQTTWWITTGFVVATDLLIFLLPIPIVLPLNLPRRQKAAVMGIFLIGFFTVFVSFTRLVILIQEKGQPDPDFTYNGTTLTYWTLIEPNTAIVVACAMTMKPLVGKLFPGLLESRPSQNETSLAGSGPQLTIGSKPSRNPLSPANRHSWMELPDRNDKGDIILSDLEAALEEPGRPVASSVSSTSKIKEG